MNLGDAPRVIVTTFDAAAHPTKSAEFIVPLGEDRVAVWTPHSAPWAQRLSLSDVVSVQAASARGAALRAEPVLEGRAQLVTEGADYEAARTLTEAKYGLAAKVANAVDWAWEFGGARTPHGAVLIHVVG